jgi:hypothetical protein
MEAVNVCRFSILSSLALLLLSIPALAQQPASTMPIADGPRFQAGPQFQESPSSAEQLPLPPASPAAAGQPPGSFVPPGDGQFQMPFPAEQVQPLPPVYPEIGLQEEPQRRG